MIGICTRLNPPIPVRVAPDLDALAHLVTDYGPGHHRVWTVQLLEGSNIGCLWDMPNPVVRINTSISDGWRELRPFTPEQIEEWSHLDSGDEEPGDGDAA